MNDSGEFQHIASTYSGKCSHVPSQPAAVPSPRSLLSRDRSMPFDTWKLSETPGNVFVNPQSMFDSTQTPYQGILHSANPSAAGAIPVQVGDQSREVKNELGAQFQCRCLQEGRRP